MLGEASNLKALKSDLVRVAASQLMASTLLPEVIGAWCGEHPTIRFVRGRTSDGPI